MEEVGLFGARQIAYSLKPDACLVVDVTHATDYPTVNQQQHGDIKIGEGPAITHGGCNHPEIMARIEQVAKARKIDLQHEAMSATSGTDTDAIFWTRGGIPSGLISLPNRYMHSPVELVSLKDLQKSRCLWKPSPSPSNPANNSKCASEPRRCRRRAPGKTRWSSRTIPSPPRDATIPSWHEHQPGPLLCPPITLPPIPLPNS